MARMNANEEGKGVVYIAAGVKLDGAVAPEDSRDLFRAVGLGVNRDLYLQLCVPFHPVPGTGYIVPGLVSSRFGPAAFPNRPVQ